MLSPSETLDLWVISQKYLIDIALATQIGFFQLDMP
jgi:hypothetical protein